MRMQPLKIEITKDHVQYPKRGKNRLFQFKVYFFHRTMYGNRIFTIMDIKCVYVRKREREKIEGSCEKQCFLLSVQQYHK